MKNEIQLTHAQKIALLEAVQSGTLDLSMFDKIDDEKMTMREIETEIVRLEKARNPRALALLTLSWCNGEISEEEYITKRIEL